MYEISHDYNKVHMQKNMKKYSINISVGSSSIFHLATINKPRAKFDVEQSDWVLTLYCTKKNWFMRGACFLVNLLNAYTKLYRHKHKICRVLVHSLIPFEMKSQREYTKPNDYKWSKEYFRFKTCFNVSKENSSWNIKYGSPRENNFKYFYMSFNVISSLTLESDIRQSILPLRILSEENRIMIFRYFLPHLISRYT